MKFLAVLSLSLSLTTASPQFKALQGLLSSLAGEDEAPGEVDDYDQVPYTVIQKFKGYEERVYPRVQWACTEATYQPEQEEVDVEELGVMEMMKMMMKRKEWKGKPSNKMFMKLFRYISGVNAEAEEIEMTVPVLMKMVPQGDLMTKQMCFYLAKATNEGSTPPQPLDKTVTIETNKKMTVMVKQFGGYAMKDAVWAKQAREFLALLNSRNVEVVTSMYYTAGYDSPMKFWNRRNEVMFLVKPNAIA